MAMPPGPASPAAPSALLSNENINLAITRLEASVAQEMKNPESTVSRDIGLFFGAARETAASKILATISQLRAYYGETILGSAGPGWARYVQDDSLPAEMPALGVLSGDWSLRTTHIKLRGSLVHDRRQAAVLAAQLLHEGTHIIDAGRTVDFAYRGTRQHYFLPDRLALYNAANYEQVAANALGVGDNSPSQGDVDTARALRADPKLLAATLLTVQITQSWAYSVKLRADQDPAGALPQIERLLALPPAATQGALRGSRLSWLEAGLRALMGAIATGASFSVGAFPTEVEVVGQGGSREIRVRANAVNAASARQLAAKGLQKLCGDLAQRNQCPFSGQQLADFISNFALFQLGDIREVVDGYLGKLT